MGMFEELKDLGVDVDEGLKRLAGNEAFYKKMLGRIQSMLEDKPIDPDFDAGDYQEVIENAHAIKGATGNLSLTPMYKAYTDIVDLLRQDNPEEARKILVDVLPVQAQIIDVINKYK